MKATKEEILEHLLNFMTESRRAKFAEVIENRTRYISVVLEDIFQPQNASAVLRTCDCFGVQDLHIIENKNEYTVNPDVALGSSKWLNLNRYNQAEFNTPACIDRLREDGFTIVAATPHHDDITLEELPLGNKVAVLFGTELNGLTDAAIENSDLFMRIPMLGFTDSFNISVSAAIVLYHLTNRMKREGREWMLTKDEKTDIMLNWARNSVRMSEALEREFISKSKR